MDGRTLRSSPFIGLIGLVALGCAGIPARAEMDAIMIPVATMSLSAPPGGFEFARTGQGGPGRWTVVEDSTANAARAIEQSSADATDNRFPLAIYQPVSARNLEVIARFKPVAGKVDQAGGIAVRVTSPNDYYLVRANALEDNVRFYRIVKGRRQQLASADTKVAGGVWHTLGLKAENDRFTISFNGKLLYSASDRTFTGPGRVALWTKSDSVTRFEDINIQVLP